MKNKILKKSSELFLTYGFKSITMDDIANKMGISKKTIYQHFNTKNCLVKETTLALFQFISEGINCICLLEKNPIDELYNIKKFVLENLKDEKSSPQYQLQKYYPKVYKTLKEKQFEVMQGCVSKNLNRGIENGYFRDDINVNFITRLYFNGIISIKDEDLFPRSEFTMTVLMNNYIEYHLRGISTQKGIEYLNNYIKNNAI